MHTCDMIQQLVEAAIETGRSLVRLEDAQDDLTECTQELAEATTHLMAFVGCNLDEASMH